MAPGSHRINIHTYGDLRNGCASTGGFYIPKHDAQGRSTDIVTYELGKVYVPEDCFVAKYQATIENVPLVGPYSVIGRAVVVDSGIDDLSGKSRNAGSRQGCGVIGTLN